MKRIRRGDMVEVIAGKEKGKRGRVTKIIEKSSRVVVERLMMVKKHTKPSQKNPQGGIVEKEGSIHLSNVMPIDSGTDKPTRVRILTSEAGRHRIGRSGTAIESQK